jgi:hypothetical protein
MESKAPALYEFGFCGEEWRGLGKERREKAG